VPRASHLLSGALVSAAWLALAGGAVAAPGWGAAETLAGPAPGAMSADVALNPGGAALVTWSMEGSPSGAATGGGVMARWRSTDGSWGPAERVSGTPPLPQAIARPRAALASDGSATVTWSAFDAYRAHTPSALGAPEANWSDAPGLVGGDRCEPATELAADAAGDVAAAFVRGCVSGPPQVGVALLQAGARSWRELEPPLRGGPDSPGSREPAVAMAPDGRILLAVTEGRGTVRALLRPAGGGRWSASRALSTGGGGRPRAALDAAGRPIVVWVRRARGRAVVEAASATGRGAWSAPVGLGRSTAGGSPGLAVAPDGTATVVWLGPGRRVRAAVRRPGRTWSAPVGLSGPGARSPEVRTGAGGETVVVWEGAGGVVAAVSRSSAGGWSATHGLSAPGAAQPRVAVGARGEALAVWSRRTHEGTILESAARGSGSAAAAGVG
jgi:hypothetical protein